MRVARAAPRVRSGQSPSEPLNLPRFLGNELRIPLVGAGTRDADLAIRSGGQLENRFAPFVLPMMTRSPRKADIGYAAAR
ncbi:TniB family NTP-binding protein [Nonomuraea dietziae]|uniref:TniB family NTP-binding protein n=1 Tax=Nonomuraea dietziae TaxID=65515 RepID=UPI003F4CE131